MRLHSSSARLRSSTTLRTSDDGALAFEHGAHRLLQRLLVVGELELHALSPP